MPCTQAVSVPPPHRTTFLPGIAQHHLWPSAVVNTGLLSKAGLAEATIASSLSVEEGASTAVFLASDPAARGVSGEYFADGAVVRPPEVSAWALSEAEAEALWDASLRFTGLTAETFGGAA